MSAHPLPRGLTADEFMAWSLDQPGGRFELLDGEVVAMAPERVAHARAKLAAARALGDAVRRAGLPCEAFPDGMSVRVAPRTVYEPDALVRCGPPLADDDVEVRDPVVVVEVLSPSTGSVDLGGKLAGYFDVPSVAHYLILDPRRRIAIHHRRTDAEIATRVLRPGQSLALDPPGVSIRAADLLGDP